MSIRLFINAPLAAGAEIELTADQAHYLATVMRRKAGERVLAFNGRDGEWSTVLADIGKRRGLLRADVQTRPQTAEPDIRLAFAPVKKAGTDFIVEKATELGVSELIPIITRRTETQRVNLERLNATAREAAEQCERLSAPKIHAPQGLTEFLNSWPLDARLLVMDETGGGQPIAEALPGLRAPLGILTGPEGGFDTAELDALAAMAFVTPVGLGPRVLRAETAALAALACCQALIGDWRSGRRRVNA